MLPRRHHYGRAAVSASTALLTVTFSSPLAASAATQAQALPASASPHLPGWLTSRPGWGPTGFVAQAHLSVYSGSGSIDFNVYNGSVPHWFQHDVPDLKGCLAAYAPKVHLIVSDPKGNASLQTTQTFAALAQGIKLLVLTPATLDPSAIISAAKNDHVPVIDYASPTEHVPPHSFVAVIGDGPTEIGAAQGQWVLQQHFPKGTQIALINGDLGTEYAQLMRLEQLKVLQPAISSGALKVVADDSSAGWAGSAAETDASGVLTAHPQVKAIIAGADFLASGIVNALKTAGYKPGQVKMIGLDGDPIGLQNMLLGWQTATVIKSSDNEASANCVAVISTLEHKALPKSVFNATWNFKTPPAPFRDTPIKVINGSQISLALAWDTATKPQLCLGLPKGLTKLCP